MCMLRNLGSETLKNIQLFKAFRVCPLLVSCAQTCCLWAGELIEYSACHASMQVEFDPRTSIKMLAMAVYACNSRERGVQGVLGPHWSAHLTRLESSSQRETLSQRAMWMVFRRITPRVGC